MNFRNLIETKCGVKGFPFTHTNKYRQVTFIDINNIFGRGCNAIYSLSGLDKSYAMYAFDSPLGYLQLHFNTLKGKKFFVNKGELSIFRKNPEEFFGSTTITKSMKVEAQAWLVHQFCRLDKDTFHDAPRYYFVYQHRISVDSETAADFRPCKMLVRN